MVGAAIAAWLAAVVFFTAALAWRKYQRAQTRERAIEVLHRYVPPPEKPLGRLSALVQPWIESVKGRLWQAGIEPAQWQVTVLLVLVVIVVIVGGSTFGGVGALIGVSVSIAMMHGAVVFQAERRRRLMIDQLPGFVDQLLRMVNVGNTLDESVVAATREAPMPLRAVFEPVVRQTHLGGSLDEALEAASERYKLKEVMLLTMAVRISRRYGSGIREMLKSIVTMVREQERARQELRGMTSETRASAWILGAMPLLLVVYMLFVNPAFFLGLWSDSTGRVLIVMAVALQLSGIAVMWRLLRRV
ncbi:MAG: hypothetical protein EA349_14060 [Halomonadaceae bacterium]|nr:MAG: hypothetical protein EA349_14060 [Halomonadaceae bacterium]